MKTLKTTWNGLGWLLVIAFVISPIIGFSAGLAYLNTTDLLVLPIVLLIYSTLASAYLIGVVMEMVDEKKKQEEKPLPIGIVLDTEENRKKLGQYIDEKV